MNDISSRILWYKQPAKDWNQALPIGNGRLGGMIFGGVKKEQIQLNEDSLWSGGHIDRNNPDCFKNLGKIRELIATGEIEKAQDLMRFAITGTPQLQRVYQTLCDMNFEFDYDKNAVEQPSSYERSLDLETAVSTVHYNVGEVGYRRDIFCSAPDDVIVAKFTANSSGKISFRATLSRQIYFNRVWSENGNTIAIDGDTGKDGISFCAMMQAQVKGGKVSTIGEYLIVEDADEALLIFTAATSFRQKDFVSFCRDTIKKAFANGYQTIYDNHIKDYSSMYNRASLNIEDTPEDAIILQSLPTDERIRRFRDGNPDNALTNLYFNFGRYLLISCSRPGTLPANLQGIWNNEMDPPWGSKFTININTEMNYWLAEVCNLSDCHEPLFDHLERMLENGKHTAAFMYHCRGFVAHHNTDIWGDTAPQDLWMPATHWVLGGAWLCLHIWEHYDFNRDPEFLKRMYSIIKESALFFVDYLIEDKDGNLVISPTVSPENTYIHPNGRPATVSMGCTLDTCILHELFTDCIEISKILNVDEDFATTLRLCMDKLPKLRIGKHGQIMEWNEDYDEFEPGHRHISQLFSLYPAAMVTPRATPELAQAARATIERRLKHGGGHTGWSRAWIINMWARLLDADKAYENIRLLIANSTQDNLFDTHPPFQIDGNFGGTAGITEMLLQSQNGEILLLPALPRQWANGAARGLKVRGGAVVSFEWASGKLKSFSIEAQHGFDTKIVYRDKEVDVHFNKGDKMLLNEELEPIK